MERIDLLRLAAGGVATAAAMWSGTWWMKAASAEVQTQGNAGVGMGGTPVNVLNARGEVIDFIRSNQLQSKYNSRAAVAAAVSAFAAAVLFLLNTPWPL
ncbi:hypothetical protein [Bradyrhizobium sp. SZCCHNR3015]|uniref:hypothetical protein n=1 Tax=Bradyrhizobium sp. SZCCHNR3015 TaxID=3057395 RepID=UPI002916589A|nr:hypothetical protein [Bradyrhizobium sp. SZCCHNR3015]